jgi:thiamine-monophosphate kinase
VDEFEIIRRYFTPATYSDSVVIGVGDDGAVLRPTPGMELVAVADTMVAGVHYPDVLAAADVGYRAVAVNLSDIAAMGAIPRWMTLALTLSAEQPAWLADFARGITQAAAAFGLELVGGDMTRGEQTVVTVQITGEVLPGQALTRAGAHPGEGIYVSGTPGDAAMGLRILQSGSKPDSGGAELVQRFARPTARIALGRALAAHASAAIDLSDGLFSDVEKLLHASGAAGCLALESLPISAPLLHAVPREEAERLVLSGGDDYELCFTAADTEFLAAGEVAGVPVTRIGEVREGRGLHCERHGQLCEFRDDGYRHFQ